MFIELSPPKKKDWKFIRLNVFKKHIYLVTLALQALIMNLNVLLKLFFFLAFYSWWNGWDLSSIRKAFGHIGIGKSFEAFYNCGEKYEKTFLRNMKLTVYNIFYLNNIMFFKYKSAQINA